MTACLKGYAVAQHAEMKQTIVYNPNASSYFVQII